ncbi:hypothetical protein [Caulobacter sp. UC70_42]|uniref:hypothetical protein n=1 Tax=Caulobacter sp. UC70_42 TaxID=3374551 RepID=UPI003757BF30
MSEPWKLDQEQSEAFVAARVNPPEPNDALREAAAVFTVDDLAFGEEHPVLGPHYEVGRRAADAFMEQFQAEHFKPLVDKFTDDFRDKLWSDVETFLLSDVTSNLHGSMDRMVEGTVRAILTGEAWALNFYPLAKSHDGQKVREAVFVHCRDQITDMRVTELETEVEKLKKDLEWERQNRRF